nr:hypothetical protein [Tanacetum cinerariifolium]
RKVETKKGVTGCKWKPRKVSAKRDFPKAFGEVAMNHTKLSKIEPTALLDVPQNISDDGHDDVSQFPKKQKVSAVEELSNVTAGDYIENVAPVESEEGFTNTRKFDLSNESTDIVRDDYAKDELVTSDPVSVESSSSTEMLEHEDTDVVELTNTDEATHYAKRKVSAIRCFAPGCGRNAFAQSEEELDDLAEFENYSSTCKTCRDDDIEEDGYSEAESDNYTELELPEENAEEKRRPRVWAVGFFPPGCGPDAANLTEEDVKVALTESSKGMLTCKSLRDDDIEEDTYSEAESDDYTELELREENAEEKRQYQTDGQMKVQVIVANLHNNGIDVEPAREESGTHKSVSYRMMDEERDPREQLHPCRPRV